MKKTKIIAVTNQKGGVAKTTTATAMAAELKQQGYKTLLIDTDPQCNATDTFRAVTKDVATLYDALIEVNETKIDLKEYIQNTDAGDIIAGDPLLSTLEQRLTEQGREYRLREVLTCLENTDYDYVIIDTPPNLGLLLTNALTAADSCIIPIAADRYSLQGLSQLDESIGRVRKYSNQNLKIEGLLLCRFNPNQVLSKTVLETGEEISRQLGTKIFKTHIRESVATQKAQAARMTIYEYDNSCNTALDYRQFVKEYLEGEN